MKKVIATLVLLALAAPAMRAAVEGHQVLYVGGTIPNLKEGTTGRFESTREDALVFEYADGKAEISYKAIRSFQYSPRLARRLGVVATLAVVLVKHRQRRHFIEITFRGDQGIAQAAVFEVSKDMAQPIVATLEARAPRPCPPSKQPTGQAQAVSNEPCRVPAIPLYYE